MLTDYWGLVRAKRVDTEEWVEGTYYRRTWISSSNRGKSTISQEVATHFVIVKNSSRSDGSPPEIFLEVFPDTICPYTGREDEEGNRIFAHIESECTVEKLFWGLVRANSSEINEIIKDSEEKRTVYAEETDKGLELKVSLPNLRGSNLEEYELIKTSEKVYRFREIEKEKEDGK